MPIRSNPTPKLVSLGEVLHFVQFGTFRNFASNPNNSTASEAPEVSISNENVRQEEAKQDVFLALRDGDLKGRGRFSDTLRSDANHWAEALWHRHGKSKISIDIDFWSENGIDWIASSAKNPGGEFVDVVVPVRDVIELWGSEEKLPSEGSVPASDRLVARTDNSAAYDNAVKKLDDLILMLPTANDIGDLTAEERSVILSGLRESRKLFDAPSLKLSAVRALIEPKLRWLADKAGGAVVGLAAIDVLKAILTLFLS